MSPPNYQNLKGQGQIGANEGVPGVISLAWQLPACAMLYDVLFFGAHCECFTHCSSAVPVWVLDSLCIHCECSTRCLSAVLHMLYLRHNS